MFCIGFNSSQLQAPLARIELYLALASEAMGLARHYVQDVLCCPPSGGLAWPALLEAGHLAHAYDNVNQTVHRCYPSLWLSASEHAPFRVLGARSAA